MQASSAFSLNTTHRAFPPVATVSQTVRLEERGRWWGKNRSDTQCCRARALCRRKIDRERVKPDYQAAELELSFELRRAGSSSARRTIWIFDRVARSITGFEMVVFPGT